MLIVWIDLSAESLDHVSTSLANRGAIKYVYLTLHLYRKSASVLTTTLGLGSAMMDLRGRSSARELG